ncbi:MAG: hypothetical protein LZF62_490005 [Nitrospira sp.]|nr:MAG: hypothetical protein LZF62_490005 [Nitrospira sp.]
MPSYSPIDRRTTRTSYAIPFPSHLKRGDRSPAYGSWQLTDSSEYDLGSEKRRGCAEAENPVNEPDHRPGWAWIECQCDGEDRGQDRRPTDHHR